MEQETDTTAWVAMDSLFHLAVARAAQNPVFRRVIEEIRDALATQSAFLNELGGRPASSPTGAPGDRRGASPPVPERDAVTPWPHHLERVETPSPTSCGKNSKTK